VAISFLAGIVIERIIIRPWKMRRLSVVTVLHRAAVIFNSVAGWIFTLHHQDLPSPFPEQPLFGKSLHLVGTSWAPSHHADGAGAAVSFSGSHRWTGDAGRSAERGVEPAGGIRVGWMLALAGGSRRGGSSGRLLVRRSSTWRPNMMSGVLLYAFAAALVGGIETHSARCWVGSSWGVLENLIGLT